ncbi:MAG: hypothetical protein K0R31_566 [Clostridiales bacterium]|jgi:hypothetical protein|nr:hypothetical protein [Clostridiales bacterium]
MFIKYLVYAFITIAGILLTFFGLGPVLFADGSMQERLLTLFSVIILYALLGILLAFWIRRNRKIK